MADAIRPDRVAIYIRWSTEDQAEGTTLEVQREACEHFVRSQGWQVRADLLFVDDGCSGGNLRRPALTALRSAIRAGAVDCAVCFKLDRLSRCVVDTVNLVLEEWEGRCFFKSAREAIDTTTPAGKMFFYLLASYAEWERNVIRERTMSGRVARARQGRWVQGPPPYGYRKDAEKRLVIHAPEAGVVRAIYAGYCAGRTLADIVRRLRAEGAPGPQGPGVWSKPLVRAILSNPAYMGVLLLGRRKTNPRHGRDPQAPRVVATAAPSVRLEHAIPPIVEPSTWDAVQRLKHERDRRTAPRSGRAYSSPWLLTGLLRCARCGSALTAHGAHQGHRPYYYCLGRVRKLNCDCVPIGQAELNAWFSAEVKRVYADRLRREPALALLAAEREQRLAELASSRQAVEVALADLERQRAVVRRRFRADEIDGEVYKGFMLEIDADADRHRACLRPLAAEWARLTAQDDAQALMAELAAADVFAALEPQDQKHLVFRLVRRLVVYRPPGSSEIQAEVTWNVPG